MRKFFSDCFSFLWKTRFHIADGGWRVQCRHSRQEGKFQSRRKCSIEQGSRRIARRAKNLLVIHHYRFKVRFVNTVIYPQPYSVAQGKSHCW